MCVCVCVCVRERERERERESQSVSQSVSQPVCLHARVRARASVHACVCVCVRQTDRQTETDRQNRQTDREGTTLLKWVGVGVGGCMDMRERGRKEREKLIYQRQTGRQTDRGRQGERDWRQRHIETDRGGWKGEGEGVGVGEEAERSLVE